MKPTTLTIPFVAALFATAPAALSQTFTDFDGDLANHPPMIGAFNQPTSLTVPAGGNILVQNAALGIATKPVVLSDNDGDYASVNWQGFVPVQFGVLRFEATVSVSNPVNGYFMQTTNAGTAVLSRLGLQTDGDVYDLGSGTVVGQYQAGVPFRVRMDVNISTYDFTAVVDPEMDGFTDNQEWGGLTFLNAGLNEIGGVLTSINVFGNGSVTIAYDDVYFGPPCIGTPACSLVVPNSTGMPGTLCAVGSNLVMDQYLYIEAHNLPPGQPGYFLVAEQAGIPFQPPGSQGFLCLNGPIGRYSFNVGFGPSFTQVIDLANLPTVPAHAVVAAETWYFQCWYRDNNPGPTSNFTEAICIQFL